MAYGMRGPTFGHTSWRASCDSGFIQLQVGLKVVDKYNPGREEKCMQTELINPNLQELPDNAQQDLRLKHPLVGINTILPDTKPNLVLGLSQADQYVVGLRSFIRIIGMKSAVCDQRHCPWSLISSAPDQTPLPWSSNLTKGEALVVHSLGDLTQNVADKRAKKQMFTARSRIEVEYHALADTTANVVSIRWLLEDLGAPQSSPTDVFCDNRNAI
ncbi:uncharacterized protein LOC130957573 [Arachis stenosperma]|uniref:uncharacterized protein LOC130957573 n=1 Tax=Arachis stenosperma TaxID=217475 RepID=UPI0025AB900E|nr:uncharacterized protein LOC130957573 [Arachis stenosperma]